MLFCQQGRAGQGRAGQGRAGQGRILDRLGRAEQSRVRKITLWTPLMCI